MVIVLVVEGVSENVVVVVMRGAAGKEVKGGGERRRGSVGQRESQS